MADPSAAGPITWDRAPAEEAALVGKVIGRVEDWEKGIGTEFRERCNRFFEQYRGFRRFADAWERTAKNDVDTRKGLVYEAGKHWGAHLHIPLSFRTIETIVPRAIAHAPKLLVLPRDEQWRKNVETVRLLIDAQQEQIDIDLAFQAVMRSGHIYGLGPSKCYWRRETKTRRRMEREAIGQETGGTYTLGEPREEVTFDDPMFEDVDVFDFMWDPRGSDPRTCEWLVHRIWMSREAVQRRVESGVWATKSAQLLKADTEKIDRIGPEPRHYDQIWQQRMQASGFSHYRLDQQSEHPHELLEYHDGQRVISVLDRQVLVQDGENACGEMPFQVFRPTPLAKQMVGIGSLEPLEHLQRELDTLRSQRRDLVTIGLAGGYAYDSAVVDEEDLEFGPNRAIPVNGARPTDAITPLQIRDVPGSGYQEEAAILRDFDLVSGMMDAADNSPGGQSGTATEASIVQAALGRRIELTSRRFEIEVVRNVARCFLYLDQRMIQQNRSQLRMPGQGPEEEIEEASRWKWFPVGPGELEGEYEIVPEGGSMAARNLAQDRSDAQMILNNLAHDWYINPTKARLRAMELLGIKHPQSWLRDPTPAVPMLTLRFLLQAGVDQSLLIQSVLRARELSAPQEGPAANQIAEQVGSEGSA